MESFQNFERRETRRFGSYEFWRSAGGSVVRTSVCGWQTFPDLRLIYG